MSFRLRFNVSQGEYCPWCQDEGWVTLLIKLFDYHDAHSVTGCRWCEIGDRLLRKFPWLPKDYGCEDVDVSGIDLDKRHILRPDEINQLERMLQRQRSGKPPAQRPSFVQPTLGSLDP